MGHFKWTQYFLNSSIFIFSLQSLILFHFILYSLSLHFGLTLYSLRSFIQGILFSSLIAIFVRENHLRATITIMIRYLFGSRDDTQLVNEPTVDYNHTLDTQRHWNVIDNLSDSDSEDEHLNRDYDALVDNLTRRDQFSTSRPMNLSLPSNYPGKFDKEFKSEPRHTYNPPRDQYSRKSEDQGLSTSIEQAIRKIRAQNEYLGHLSDLISLNNDPAVQGDLTTDFEARFKELKIEYIAEMKRSQELYKGYYKLILKYRKLKNKLGPTPTNSMQDRAPIPIKLGVKIKEKLQFLKTRANDDVTVNTVNEILAELGNLEGQLKSTSQELKEVKSEKETL